jgi:hypothetical protein
MQVQILLVVASDLVEVELDASQIIGDLDPLKLFSSGLTAHNA